VFHKAEVGPALVIADDQDHIRTLGRKRHAAERENREQYPFHAEILFPKARD
jgi:hypothetical protein